MIWSLVTMANRRRRLVVTLDVETDDREDAEALEIADMCLAFLCVRWENICAFLTEYEIQERNICVYYYFILFYFWFGTSDTISYRYMDRTERRQWGPRGREEWDRRWVLMEIRSQFWGASPFWMTLKMSTTAIDECDSHGARYRIYWLEMRNEWERWPQLTARTEAGELETGEGDCNCRDRKIQEI